MRRQQRIADGRAELADEGIRLPSGRLEEHPAGQRVTVGVQAGRRHRDQHVTGHHRSAVDDFRLLHRADDEAGDVVLAIGVEAGHLGGLASDQRAAVFGARASDAADDLLRHGRRETSGREIVEEEQRLRALDQDVVDAVVHQISADGVVLIHHERDLELGADAVGARDQHRLPVAVAVEAEQAAERSDFGEHAWREGAARQRPDPPDRLVARVDVDACRLVVAHDGQKSSLPMRSCMKARCGDLSADSQ